MWTLKNGDMYREIMMPKKDKLTLFTKIFEQWLISISDSERILFPFVCSDGRLNWNQPLSRSRVCVVKKSCGLFPRWFRRIHKSIYGRLIFENNT